jgi:O-antigen/teichoic acid export membrane protein
MSASPEYPEPPVRPLRVNFSWTLAGNAVYQASQWGLLSVLAKLTSPEVVGRFSLGLAVTAPVIMFANLQLRSVQATDARDEYAFADYLGLRLATTLLALAVIGGIVLFSGYPPEKAVPILLVGIAKAWESLSDVVHGFLQRHERMDLIAKSLLIRGPSSLLVVAVVVYLTRNLLWALAGLASVWALVATIYDAHNARSVLRARSRCAGAADLAPQRPSLRPRWQVRTLARLSWLALPLGLTMLLISLNGNLPRYAVEHYQGTRDLGIFTAIAYLQMAAFMVIGALGQASTPRLARHYAEGDARAFRRLILRLVGIGAIVGGLGMAVAWLGARPLLSLLYGEEYAAHAEVLRWVMGATAIGCVGWFLGNAITAARFFRVQLPLLAAVTAAIGATAFLLVPSWGLAGAAAAMLVGSIVQAAGSVIILRAAMSRLSRPCPDATPR